MFEIVIGCLFIVLLLALAGWFGWQQIQNLRRLRSRGQMTPEDFAYFRRQCYRRLIGSALTVLLAFMLIGWYIFGLGDRMDRLADRADEARARGVAVQQLQPQEKDELAFGWSYALIMILVVFAWLGVACADIMAIRRYGMRHRRRIREDRMAMLRRQLPEWWRERGQRPR